MARQFSVRAKLEAQDKASPVVKRAQTAFSRFGNFLRDKFVITLSDVTRAFRALTAGIRQGAADFAAQERATAKLTAALAPLGDEADSVTAALVKQAEQLQDTTAATDEMVIAGQAMLATFTQDEEVLKRTTQAALDLAAATGAEQRAIFVALSKAIQGNTTSLQEYGLVVDQTLPPQEKLNAALAQIEQLAGGRAQAEIAGLSGAFTQLGKEVANAFEAIVQGTADQGGLAEALNSVTGFLRENRDEYRAFSDDASGALGSALNFVKEGYELMLSPIDKSRELLARWREEEEQVPPPVDAATAAIEAQRKAMLAHAAAAKKDASDLQVFADAMGELGVTLAAESNAELAKQNQLLETARDLYDRKLISLDELIESEEAVAKATREHADAVGVEAEELEGLSGTMRDVLRATEDYTTGTVEATSANVDLRREVTRTRGEFDRLTLSASRAETTQQALAAGGRLTQGGTRLRLPGGGSVLVDPPGFGGQSRECKPSRFFEGQCTVV